MYEVGVDTKREKKKKKVCYLKEDYYTLSAILIFQPLSTLRLFENDTFTKEVGEGVSSYGKSSRQGIHSLNYLICSCNCLKKGA